MKALLTLNAAVILLSIAGIKSPVFAGDSFDMATFTCSQYINSAEDWDFPLGMWIDGYLSHYTGDTQFSVEFVDSVIGLLDDQCVDHPGDLMLEVVLAHLQD